MENLQCDFLVIGSGPGGQKAAFQAAKLGKSVIIIEKDEVGGSSLNSGTIPSKSLREAILDLTNFYKKSFYAPYEPVKEVSINDLNFRLHRVINEQKEMLLKQFQKNRIQLIIGAASLIDRYHIHIDAKEGNSYEIEAKKILISTGSRPRNPENVPFDHQVILDSTRLLDIDNVPDSMIVLGGGVIGSEYASFFATLGTKVKVIDKGEHMLPLLDREIGKQLENELTKLGMEFIGNKTVTGIEKRDNRAHLSCEDGQSYDANVLLYALGREANVENLGIEKVGITLDEKGYIPVNSLFQTEVSNIFAVGDVIGGPCLAATSMEQGRLAARQAFGAKSHHFPTFFPIGIYTIPEISSVGYTQQNLNDLGFKYEVGKAYYYEIAKNAITGNDDGLFKILFHADTLEILGIQIIGRAATEVIHIGQVAMTFNATIDYFVDQVFNYPTYAEGYRIAALNGLNKVKRSR